MKRKIIARGTVLLVFAFYVLVVLAGCASVPIPSPAANTLLMGKFVVNWNTAGFSGGSGATASKTSKSNTQVYMQNVATGKTTIVTTQKDGWLFTSKLPSGDYVIQKFYLEGRMGGGKYGLTLNGPYNISVADGKVNNMGLIQIDVQKTVYSRRDSDFTTLRRDFQTEFPDSEWNSYEWETVVLK